MPLRMSGYVIAFCRLYDEEKKNLKYKNINYLVGKILQYTKAEADPEVTLKIVKKLVESETS